MLWRKDREVKRNATAFTIAFQQAMGIEECCLASFRKLTRFKWEICMAPEIWHYTVEGSTNNIFFCTLSTLSL